MQNVAQAYRQTQVGTTGQGEIVIMLYDGALRFLAQAREKMLAKDYAGKGNCISRALDVINELDSSLNVEAGGELAKNLHQLYFLCTTRLLHANLKMDLEKLKSVEDILSGLRDAFAQIVNTPEAKAACAQISSRQAASQNSGTGHRPLMTPPPASRPGTPLNQVAGLYAQNAGMRQAGPVSMPIFHDTPVMTPQQAAEKAKALHTLEAELQKQTNTQKTEDKPAVPQTPQTAQEAPPAPSAPAGFASRRMAMYNKMQKKG